MEELLINKWRNMTLPPCRAHQNHKTASALYCAFPHCSPPLLAARHLGKMQNQQLYPNHAVDTGMASGSLCDSSSLWPQQQPAARHCVKKDLLWVTPCLLLPITLMLAGIEEFLISIHTILHLPLCPPQWPKTSAFPSISPASDPPKPTRTPCTL